jgi:hypothetical protein
MRCAWDESTNSLFVTGGVANGAFISCFSNASLLQGAMVTLPTLSNHRRDMRCAWDESTNSLVVTGA